MARILLFLFIYVAPVVAVQLRAYRLKLQLLAAVVVIGDA